MVSVEMPVPGTRQKLCLFVSSAAPACHLEKDQDRLSHTFPRQPRPHRIASLLFVFIPLSYYIHTFYNQYIVKFIFAQR
jgi:hypothetical protein